MVSIAWAKKNMKLCWRGKAWLLCGMALVVLFFSAAMLGKYWLIPEMVTRRLKLELGAVWAGEMTIGQVEFRYFGPTSIRNITLQDQQGRCWLHVDALTATFRDEGLLTREIELLEIDHLNVSAYLQDGQFAIPLRPVEPPEIASSGKTVDLTRILIAHMTVGIEGENGSALHCENLRFFAERAGEAFEVSLNQLSELSSDRFSVAGTIDPVTMEVDLLGEMERVFTKTETAVLGLILKLPKGYQAEGAVAAHLTVSGCLNDPAGLAAAGTVQLDDGIVTLDDQVVLKEGSLLVKLENRNNVDVNLVGAAFCGGGLEGSFNVNTQEMAFGGNISGQEIAVAELAPLMGISQEASKGVCTFQYEFSGNRKDLSTLEGKGTVKLQDSGIKGVSLMPKIIQFLDIKDSEDISTSDAAISFTNTGLTATLQTAQVASAVCAVRAEPGGTVNLQTGQLDLFVIAVPLSDIDDFLRSLPITDIAVNLKDKLARLHIQGHWSQPPEELIKKEPMTDIKEGAVGLIKDIIASPGKIGEGIFKTFQKPPAVTDEETK